MIRINLLSDREAIRKENSRQQVSIFVLSICLLAVLLGGIHFTFYQKKRGLEEDIRYTDMALKDLQVKVGEVEKYKVLKREMEEKLQIIEVLKKGKLWVPRLLDKVGTTIPEKMWLSKVSLAATSLGMEGYAIDHETIAEFMKSLEQTNFFRNVELRLTEKKDVEGVGMKYFSLAMMSDPAQAVLLAAAGNTPGSAIPGMKTNNPSN